MNINFIKNAGVRSYLFNSIKKGIRNKAAETLFSSRYTRHLPSEASIRDFMARANTVIRKPETKQFALSLLTRKYPLIANGLALAVGAEGMSLYDSITEPDYPLYNRQRMQGYPVPPRMVQPYYPARYY